MGQPNSVQTAIVDAALAGTDVTDDDALAALCDVHIGATRAAVQNLRPLLDFEEYAEAGRAL
jgi:hypothetical protein